MKKVYKLFSPLFSEVAFEKAFYKEKMTFGSSLRYDKNRMKIMANCIEEMIKEGFSAEESENKVKELFPPKIKKGDRIYTGKHFKLLNSSKTKRKMYALNHLIKELFGFLQKFLLLSTKMIGLSINEGSTNILIGLTGAFVTYFQVSYSVFKIYLSLYFSVILLKWARSEDQDPLKIVIMHALSKFNCDYFLSFLPSHFFLNIKSCHPITDLPVKTDCFIMPPDGFSVEEFESKVYVECKKSRAHQITNREEIYYIHVKKSRFLFFLKNLSFKVKIKYSEETDSVFCQVMKQCYFGDFKNPYLLESKEFKSVSKTGNAFEYFDKVNSWAQDLCSGFGVYTKKVCDFGHSESLAATIDHVIRGEEQRIFAVTERRLMIFGEGEFLAYFKSLFKRDLFLDLIVHNRIFYGEFKVHELIENFKGKRFRMEKGAKARAYRSDLCEICSDHGEKLSLRPYDRKSKAYYGMKEMSLDKKLELFEELSEQYNLKDSIISSNRNKSEMISNINLVKELSVKRGKDFLEGIKNEEEEKAKYKDFLKKEINSSDEENKELISNLDSEIREITSFFEGNLPLLKREEKKVTESVKTPELSEEEKAKMSYKELKRYNRRPEFFRAVISDVRIEPSKLIENELIEVKIKDLFKVKGFVEKEIEKISEKQELIVSKFKSENEHEGFESQEGSLNKIKRKIEKIDECIDRSKRQNEIFIKSNKSNGRGKGKRRGGTSKKIPRQSLLIMADLLTFDYKQSAGRYITKNTFLGGIKLKSLTATRSYIKRSVKRGFKPKGVMSHIEFFKKEETNREIEKSKTVKHLRRVLQECVELIERIKNPRNLRIKLSDLREKEEGPVLTKNKIDPLRSQGIDFNRLTIVNKEGVNRVLDIIEMLSTKSD